MTPQSWTGAFLRILARLSKRPRWGNTPLPLIWLAGGEDGTAVLDSLARNLAGRARFRVPHARLEVRQGADEDDIKGLLYRLCRQLSTPTFGTDRLWFEHYSLAWWLTGQDLSSWTPDDIPAELARQLRNRTRPRRVPEDPERNHPDPSAENLFGAGQLLWWFIRRLVPHVLFRIAVSGRIPGIGRRYRWFMRQQYLAPLQSVTFPGFAERLTAGNKDSESPGQLDRLLVNAFLQDLRRAYLRRPWRIRGWRRTAYVIVLIDNVAPRNARHSLVQLINDVRNETGRSDPLLIVCAGDRSAADAAESRVVTADDLEQEFVNWRRELPWTRRARAERAWIWQLDVPARTAVNREAETSDDSPDFRPSDPPWFARRTIVAASCVMLCVPLAIVILNQAGGMGCLHSPTNGEVSVREIDGECIGYSGGGFNFNDQTGQEKLRDIQQRIFAQNAQVRGIWERGRQRRPYVTLVYLGTLTGRATHPNEEAYAAEREELEGLAVAQYDGLDTSASDQGAPLLNIVIANGGFQMRHADQAVDMIADLARHDPTVVGVVGLVDSRVNTGQALRRLNLVGLPAIAPTLSADGMHRYSNLYLQITPPNRDQATLVGQYARKVLRVSDVHIYYTSGEGATLQDDLYVSTLVTGLKKEFGRQLEYVTEFGAGVDLSSECGYSGLLFFAGRWSEFDSFLRGLATSCGDNPPTHLVADDSVNRYMANPGIRRSAPGNVPLTYVSKAALADCDQLSSRRDEESPGRFLRRIQAKNLLNPIRCASGGTPEPVGERVGLAYDSTMMVLQAVQGLGGRLRPDTGQPWNPRSITPVAVYLEIRRQNLEKPFPGVTGNISFDPLGEPVDKLVSLLHVTSIPDTAAPAEAVFQCGIAEKRDGPPTCRKT